MTDHKLTDDEIIHSLKVCSNDGDCSECLINPHKGNYGYCTSLAIKAALDLINRQKAEIERLETENKLLIENDVRNKYPNCVSVEKGRIYTRTLEDYDELIGDISAEAIKEFAERLKANMSNIARMEYGGHIYFCVGYDLIDTLVKEMTGDQG